MNWNRRSFGTATAAAAVMVAAPGGVQADLARRWPKNFLWGVSTAAHQIEGNNTQSDYWVLEHLKGSNFREPSGDACDSWNRWREDLVLLKQLGVNSYRFSIEWARIEPEPGLFSNAALAHYRSQCQALREAGIQPIVTFHHFSSPRWVAAAGGWENPEVIDHFARYCERAARVLGPYLDIACTMNEPNAQVTSYLMRNGQPFPGEAETVKTAAAAVGSSRFGAYFMGNSLKVRDVCLAAHAKAVQAIGSAAPGVRTGLTLALQDLRPGLGGEALHRRIFQEARLPFYQAAARDGFIGVQPYIRLQTGPAGYLPTPSGVMLNQVGLDASPDVIKAVVHEVRTHCTAPILVSEHGIETLDDEVRCRHLTDSINALRDCLDDGIPVLGYFHWSLLDNFEWRSGYKPKFGLFAVDRNNFRRSAKRSALVYRDWIARVQG